MGLAVTLAGWEGQGVKAKASPADRCRQGSHSRGGADPALRAHRQPHQDTGLLPRLLVGGRPRRPLLAHRLPERSPAAEDGRLQAAPVAGGRRRGASPAGQLASRHGRRTARDAAAPPPRPPPITRRRAPPSAPPPAGRPSGGVREEPSSPGWPCWRASPGLIAGLRTSATAGTPLSL